MLAISSILPDLKRLYHALRYFFKKLQLFFASIKSLKIILQFFSLRLYVSTEAVSCRLLERIAGRDGDGLNLEELGHFFQGFNALPAKIIKHTRLSDG